MTFALHYLTESGDTWRHVSNLRTISDAWRYHHADPSHHDLDTLPVVAVEAADGTSPIVDTPDGEFYYLVGEDADALSDSAWRQLKRDLDTMRDR